MNISTGQRRADRSTPVSLLNLLGAVLMTKNFQRNAKKYLELVLGGGFVSSGCCNKVAQTWWCLLPQTLFCFFLPCSVHGYSGSLSHIHHTHSCFRSFVLFSIHKPLSPNYPKPSTLTYFRAALQMTLHHQHMLNTQIHSLPPPALTVWNYTFNWHVYLYVICFSHYHTLIKLRIVSLQFCISGICWSTQMLNKYLLRKIIEWILTWKICLYMWEY